MIVCISFYIKLCVCVRHCVWYTHYYAGIVCILCLFVINGTERLSLNGMAQWKSLMDLCNLVWKWRQQRRHLCTLRFAFPLLLWPSKSVTLDGLVFVLSVSLFHARTHTHELHTISICDVTVASSFAAAAKPSSRQTRYKYFARIRRRRLAVFLFSLCA